MPAHLTLPYSRAGSQVACGLGDRILLQGKAPGNQVPDPGWPSRSGSRQSHLLLGPQFPQILHEGSKKGLQLSALEAGVPG